MALKKPGELFGRKVKEDIPPISVDESFPHIKEEFHKVEDLRKQIDSVSSSLNNSLTEVVDKNLNFLSKEYSEQLNKFNHKIDILKEEIDTKVDSLEKSNQYLKAEIEVVEQRQQTINLNRIKKEVISEVQNLLSGDVSDNIKRLEEKIEVVRGSYQQTLNEGLLNEPPSTKNSDPLTPLDKDYVTLQEFQAQYKIFLNRIQQQMATIGGGGAVRIQDMDDVDLSSAQVNNKFLKYDSASGKWVGSNASGGSGSDVVDDTTPQLGGNLDLNGKYITGTGGINVTGVVTATSFSGTVPSSSLSGALPALDGSALTGVTGSGSGIVIKHDGSAVGTAGTINFSTNLDVSAISAGIVTVTASGGSGLSTEEVQDIVGAMFSGNTETNIAATYQDSDGTIDLVSTDTQLSTEEVQDIVGAMFSGNTETNITATYQDSDGTIDLVASGGGGGSGLDTRGTTSAATGSIAQTASANITISTRGKSFSLLKVAIDAPAWVVLYVDSASRSSDASRTEGTDPAPGSGVLTEVSTTTSGASTFLMSPAVLGWNNDSTPAAQVYAKVTNKRSSTGSNAITVTLTTVSLEA